MLFREYRNSAGSPECFTALEEELATLPGRYAPPQGRLLLAQDNEAWIGCVALRKLDKRTCELKRLYVRPTGRGSGLGKLLIDQAMHLAAEAGYNSMKLDTLPQMTAAIRLYRTMGFREIPAYTHNPVTGTLYFEINFRR